jgi:L-threonylcarbamoyladenylate synthase
VFNPFFLSQKNESEFPLISTYSVSNGDNPLAEVYILSAGDRDKPETIARSLYNCLRLFDTLAADVIFTEGIAETGLGRAIMNRLSKAAGGRVEYV